MSTKQLFDCTSIRLFIVLLVAVWRFAEIPKGYARILLPFALSPDPSSTHGIWLGDVRSGSFSKIPGLPGP